MNTERRALRCVVAGRVQGVHYRASAKARAVELALDGWARNLDDGRVEVVAAGSVAALEELTRWLWQGPPAARVDSVSLESWGDTVLPGFGIQR